MADGGEVPRASSQARHTCQVMSRLMGASCGGPNLGPWAGDRDGAAGREGREQALGAGLGAPLIGHCLVWAPSWPSQHVPTDSMHAAHLLGRPSAGRLLLRAP